MRHHGDRPPHGSARAHLYGAASSRGVLVLGHGAGGGIGAADLVEAKDVALSAGSLGVALVEQPYRVAGRRSPPPGAASRHLLARGCGGTSRPLVPRAAPRRRRAVVQGARVACRTAHLTGAAGVLCLAFPLQPPQGERPHAPGQAVCPSSTSCEAEVLIVQGENDRFGTPPAAAEPPPSAVVPGDHSLAAASTNAAPDVAEWLQRVVARRVSGRAH